MKKLLLLIEQEIGLNIIFNWFPGKNQIMKLLTVNMMTNLIDMRKYCFLLAMCTFLCTANSFAQRPPTFTQGFDKPIDDIVINEVSGVVLVQIGSAKVGATDVEGIVGSALGGAAVTEVSNTSGSTTLYSSVKAVEITKDVLGTITAKIGDIYGFSPEKKEIIWRFSPPSSGIKDAIKKEINDVLYGGEQPILSESIALIPGTSYFQKMYGSYLYVVDASNGETVFSTSGNEIYYQAEYLFDENAFLLRGVDDGDLVIAKYSLNEKKLLWKTALLPFNERLVASKYDRLSFTKDKAFVLLRGKFFLLNRSDGTIVWKHDTGYAYDFHYSLDGSRMILMHRKKLVSFKNFVDLYDVESGEKLLDEPIDTKFVLLFEDWQDRMLLAHYKGFNFFDYTTGEKLWPKDPKGKNFKKVVPVGKDFLYAYDDELMLIDKNGQKRWKKDVKISDDKDEEILYMGATSNNRVLYVTQSLANMIDYNTGKKIWKGNLKLNEKKLSLVEFDEGNGEFLLYNSGKLYRFTETTSDKPSPFKLQLKNSRLVKSMQLFDDGLTITGQIEVVKVANDGTVVFHNKYTQPGEAARGLLKAGSIVAGVGGGLLRLS